MMKMMKMKMMSRIRYPDRIGLITILSSTNRHVLPKAGNTLFDLSSQVE